MRWLWLYRSKCQSKWIFDYLRYFHLSFSSLVPNYYDQVSTSRWYSLSTTHYVIKGVDQQSLMESCLIIDYHFFHLFIHLATPYRDAPVTPVASSLTWQLTSLPIAVQYGGLYDQWSVIISSGRINAETEHYDGVIVSYGRFDPRVVSVLITVNRLRGWPVILDVILDVCVCDLLVESLTAACVGDAQPWLPADVDIVSV